MLFSSLKKQAKPVLPVSISKPIRYYTNDSLHFNTSKDKLYGEIYSKECMTQFKDELTCETASSLRSNDITRMLLYTLIALLSLTSLILYATIIPLWESNFEHTRSPIRGDWTDGLLLLPLSISFISAAVIVSRWIVQRRQQQRRQRHNHHQHHHGDSSKVKHDSIPVPFYTMLLSSTLILLLTPLLILASTNSLSRAFRSSPPQLPPPSTSSPSTSSSSLAGTPPTSSTQGCTMTNIMTKPCVPILYRIGELQIGGAVTAGLVCSLWITVFVLAVRQYFRIKSYELHRRRRHKERRQARRDARRHARRQRQQQQQTDDQAGKVDDAMHVKKNMMDSKQTRFPVKVYHQPGRLALHHGEHVQSRHGMQHTCRSSEQIIGLSRPQRAY